MPVLSIAANSLSNFHQFIIKSNKPQIYEQSYESLRFTPLVHIDGQFTDLSSHQLKQMSNSVVNNILSNHLNLQFPNSMVIYTDGSVSRLSDGSLSIYPSCMSLSLITSLLRHLSLLQSVMQSMKPFYLFQIQILVST